MRTKTLPWVVWVWPCLGWSNTAPVPVVVSAAMRPGTTLLDVVYRIEDADDATVKVRTLAFIDGMRSFAKVIKPVTFVEGTAANTGDAISTNVAHTLTWDVASDWAVDVGQLKFEVLCLDQRGLLSFDWIGIPAAGGQPALTISKGSPPNDKLLDGLFWHYAMGDPQLVLDHGVLRGTAVAGRFNGILLADGGTAAGYAAPFLFKQMNVDVAALADVTYADVTARAGLVNPTDWHALNRPFGGLSLVAAWGYNGNGQCNVPAGTSNVVAITAGAAINAVLRADGTVVSWGPWSSGMPADLTGVTAVDAGDAYCVALKADGTVVAWGSNTFHETSVPAALNGVTGVSAGPVHALAVRNDGSVVAWGDNSNQQLNVPGVLANVTAVAAGCSHSLALKHDGTVTGWGDNSSGQLNPPAGLAGVVAITAGWSHSLALKNDGTVTAWGSNEYGQCDVPAGLAGVVAIAAGHFHNLALKSDGTVVAWGQSTNGKTNVPAGLGGVTAIAAGGSHSMALVPNNP